MSTFVNTGNERAEVLLIHLEEGGSELDGYPKEYNIRTCMVTDANGGGGQLSVPNTNGGASPYQPMQLTEFQRLDSNTYDDRVADFVDYIETDYESGYNHNTDCENSSTQENLSNCPIDGGAS